MSGVARRRRRAARSGDALDRSDVDQSDRPTPSIPGKAV